MAENETAGALTTRTDLETALAAAGAKPQDMPLALRLWFDDRLFDRCRLMAKYLAEAKGIVPSHLFGQQQACFFVVEKALGWNLSPSAVAAATFVVQDGGKIGFEGKLVHAIIEQSGRLQPGTGGVRYEHFGPWENVEGKFEIKRSDRGKDYAAATWKRGDAKGVGVIVRARLKGEAEDRVLKFNLEQAFPLNSTLWATDPRTQICYLAVRRFANLVAPSLIMGVPFDGSEPLDDDEVARASRARDITPAAPTRAEFDNPVAARTAAAAAEHDGGGEKAAPAQILTVTSVPDGEVAYEGEDPAMFMSALAEQTQKVKGDKKLLEALWENNSPDFFKLPKEMADEIRASWPGGAPKTQPALKV